MNHVMLFYVGDIERWKIKKFKLMITWSRWRNQLSSATDWLTDLFRNKMTINWQSTYKTTTLTLNEYELKNKNSVRLLLLKIPPFLNVQKENYAPMEEMSIKKHPNNGNGYCKQTQPGISADDKILDWLRLFLKFWITCMCELLICRVICLRYGQTVLF